MGEDGRKTEENGYSQENGFPGPVLDWDGRVREIPEGNRNFTLGERTRTSPDVPDVGLRRSTCSLDPSTCLPEVRTKLR